MFRAGGRISEMCQAATSSLLAELKTSGDYDRIILAEGAA